MSRREDQSRARRVGHGRDALPMSVARRLAVRSVAPLAVLGVLCLVCGLPEDSLGFLILIGCAWLLLTAAALRAVVVLMTRCPSSLLPLVTIAGFFVGQFAFWVGFGRGAGVV